jgi:uncharacterized membrane protein YeaQ/YmgE (transglycosylase-associated protein family)
MTVLTWLVVGLLAGFIASRIFTKQVHAQGLLMDIVLGIAGACAGGWLFNKFGEPSKTEFNGWSGFVAIIGAAILLALYHAMAAVRGARPISDQTQ